MSVLERYKPDAANSAFEVWRIALPVGGAVRLAVRELIGRLADIRLWEDSGIGRQATSEQVAEVIASMRKTDMLLQMMWTPRVVPPEGWVACDGALYDKADYPEAYDAIDPALRVGEYGFIVPNMMGRYPVGAAPTEAVGSIVGANEVTLTEQNIPSHQHSTPSLSHTTMGHSHAAVLPVAAGAVTPGELPVPIPTVVPGLTGIQTGTASEVILDHAASQTGSWGNAAPSAINNQPASVRLNVFICLKP